MSAHLAQPTDRAAAAATAAGQPPLLSIENLQIAFRKSNGWLPVINTANLALGPDEAVGIVGESGSGKTMLCRGLIGTLSRHGAAIRGGHINFGGRDLAQASERTWRKIRGREIGYVPQSSLAGLNPVLTVGTQLVEAITAVRAMSSREAEKEALDLLDMVHIPRAKTVLKEHANRLSGGMRQRVMIAAALAQRPKLLVADEPTTALDVSVQKEILTLIRRLRQQLGMALVLVSHDLAVIEEVCDSLMVMYAGATMASGSVEVVVRNPRHPYTRALRDSRVDIAERGRPLATISGEPPTVGAWPTGCRFWPRCPVGDETCRPGEQPALAPSDGQLTACLYPERLVRSE